MKDSIPEDEFVNLVMRYHDDDLSQEENERLNEILKSSPEHVKLFNDISIQCTQILNYASLEVGYESEKPVPEIVKVEKNTLSKLIALAALIAVSLVSVAVIMSSGKQTQIVEVSPAKSYPAKITGVSKDLLWEQGEKQYQTNEGLDKGWYRLKQGTLDIVYGSGAEVSIKGPAYFAVVSEMQSYLEYGDVSVYAPESARNFTIKAPTMDVVDLGTKFSLKIDPNDGESKVDVTEGLVNLHLKSPTEDKKLQSLSAGSKANLDSNGKLLSVEGESDTKPNLIAHWTFDEIRGTEVPDSSGNGLHGKLHGKLDSLQSDGVSGKAFDLSGEQYVDISDKLGTLPKNHFTISAWVKNPVNMIFSMSDGTKHNRLQFERYKNRLLYGWQKGNMFDPIYSLMNWEKDRWYHVAYTYSGGNISLYRDGVEVISSETYGRLNTRALGPIDFTNLSHAYIGRLYKGTPSPDFPDSIQKLMGQIDDFQIYGNALTQTQLKYIFENPGKTLK
ncbi:MAG: FecR domain-containing protein [Lentisphaeraceae bacterium]|nr:FecR domain-containing protein [Lentisphaeraceae bacterium]